MNQRHMIAILEAARNHLDDLQSGVEQGFYDENENRGDIMELEEALAAASPPYAFKQYVAVVVVRGQTRNWCGYTIRRAVIADDKLWTVNSIGTFGHERSYGGAPFYTRKNAARKAAETYGTVLPGFYEEAGVGKPAGLLVPAAYDAHGKALLRVWSDWSEEDNHAA